MKNSWARSGLWLLLLLLKLTRVDNTNEFDEVPREFQKLEYYRSIISKLPTKQEDVRDNLQQWTTAKNRGDSDALYKVASSSANRNDENNLAEISQLDDYDQHIIIQLDSDITVKNAAESLFNKETTWGRPRTLLEWNEQSGQFIVRENRGNNAIVIAENTKLSVVGHGGERGGKASVGGKTADQLAKVLLKLRDPTSPLHWPSKLYNIKKISIVSCNVGAGKQGEVFAQEFFQEMKKGLITIDSLSLRTVKVIVKWDGSKVTDDPDYPEWVSRHNPEHKLEFYIDKDGNLIKISDAKGRRLVWERKRKFAQEYDPLMEPNNPLYYQDKDGTYLIPDEYIGQVISETIQELFSQNVNQRFLIAQPINVFTPAAEEVQVNVVNGLNGLLENIKNIIETANNKRRTLLEDKKYKNQLKKINTKNLHIKDIWTQVMELRDTDNNIREMYDSIERDMAKSVKYFSFKDFVYSINMNDFYVTLYGTTNQNIRNKISILKATDVTYDKMNDLENDNNFVMITKFWINGNQNKITNFNHYDGMAVLATHIAEVVRNPDMYIANFQLWDVVYSWKGFHESNPMPKGGTWSNNHAAIGLHYQTDNQNTQEKIKMDTVSIMKHWLTINNPEYFTFYPETEGKEMALDKVRTKLRDVIQPITINLDAQLGELPLSENKKNDILATEKQVRENSLETELYLKMMEDRKNVVEKVNEKIKQQTPDVQSKYQKVKSIERYENGVKIILENKLKPSETKEVLIPGMKDTLKSEQILNSYFGESHSVSSKINHGLGIYGSLMGLQASNQMFPEDIKLEGDIMLAHGVHGQSKITGVNAAVNDFVGKTSQKSIATISTHLDKTAASKFTSAISAVGSAAREVPILSAAYTAFNIYPDLEQDIPLGIVDAVLDETIFISSLSGPEMLPVTVALSIIRLAIDPLYNEFRHELEALPPNASGWDKCVAIIKGVGLAKRDMAKHFLDLLKQINIYGVVYNAYKLEEEHKMSMDTVHRLQSAENYLRILDEKDVTRCRSNVDFTQGGKTVSGGNLRVELTDLQSMIVTLTDPVTLQKTEKKISFEKGCDTEDIILGIGELVQIKMQQKTATVLWIIPVKTREVISSMTPNDRSLYGTYIGNAKPNRFFAVQKNIVKGLPYTPDNYHYELYGRDGNDIFYLGPQMTLVHGGNGQDIYYIPLWGGKTEICNQATDKAMDLLVFNITFAEINARKIGNDLKLFYNNLHEIVIKKWFLGEEYQHLSFKSSDGILFDMGQVQVSGKVDLHPVTLDISNQDSVRNIDLQNKGWKTVVTVIGTDFDDILNGNQMNNVIEGRGGANTLVGREGKDIYIIKEKKSCDTIDNFANDDLMDIVELLVDFKSLKVTIMPPYSLKISDPNGKICVIIKDWKRGWQWQHIIFKTNDLVVFQVSNTTAQPQINPLLLDYRDSKEGVNINLNSIPGNEQIMTVIGSSYFDTIQGNSKTNLIQKGKGGGNLKGGDGSDTYIVDCSPGTISINNYAEDGSMDVLYIKEQYSNLGFQKSTQNIPKVSSVRTVTPYLEIKSKKCHILLENWFKSEQYRHLEIRTEDGIIFSIPHETKPVIYAIDNSRNTLPMNSLDTRSGVYIDVTKIIGPSKFIEIFGNAKDNYIDPGTNGAKMTGGDGRDTYQLRNNYERGYDINNYATDNKVDYLVLDVNYKDIQHAIEIGTGNTKHIMLSAPSVAKWHCRLLNFGTNENYRHLIVQTNDVWFTFTKDTLAMQPLFSNYKFSDTELHLDLVSGIIDYLPVVYGSLQERNFIDGTVSDNTLIGGKNTDILYGKNGNDVLQGSGGKDYLSGGPGDDKIHGGEGDDFILGEAGNDLIYPGNGADTVYGGTGSDTLLFLGNINRQSGVYVNLYSRFGLGGDAEGDLYFGIENILGTSYDDILIGNNYNNYISGGGGNDLIQPMGGSDVLHGGEGKDAYNLIDASGTKMINNFAMDEAEDLLYIDCSNLLKITDLKSNYDRELSFYYTAESKARLRVLVQNWYRSGKHSHLRFHIYKECDKKLFPFP